MSKILTAVTSRPRRLEVLRRGRAQRNHISPIHPSPKCRGRRTPPAEPTAWSSAPQLHDGILSANRARPTASASPAAFMSPEHTPDPSESPSGVPGTLYGFGVQYTRVAVNLLACNADESVSTETLDDVTVDSPDGDRVVEQDKSGLAANPISDRAVPLWKTLGGWARAIRDGRIEPLKTQFRLFVAQPHSGHVVKCLHEARTAAEAQSAIETARSAVADVLADTPAATHHALSSHVRDVFALDRDVLVTVILRFELQTAQSTPADDARRLLARRLISPQRQDYALYEALGWVKTRVDRALAAGEPATIAAAEFDQFLLGYVQKFDRLGEYLATHVPPPPEAAVLAELTGRVYIRQLALVDCDDDAKRRAAADYLHAVAARTDWSKTTDVHEGSFGEFEDSLERQWRALRDLIRVERPGESDVVLGQILLHRCLLHRARLQGMEVPGFFTPGSLHALADCLRVGWHPDYRARLNVVELAHAK